MRSDLKIRFYMMSLWLLFVLTFLLTVDIPVSFTPNAKFIGWIPLLKRNVLSIISASLALISYLLTCRTKYEWKGVTNPPHKINSIKNENYEYLTFLTTYIIPLICIDLKNIRYIIILGILLIVIGSIFVKMDLYYGNPTLALMGYRLYRAEINNLEAPDSVILLSKDHLSRNSSIKWIEIDKYVWIAKEIRNDSE